MKEIQIKFATSYSLYIGKDILKTSLLVDVCKTLNKRYVIITDNNVATLWGDTLLQSLTENSIPVELLTFPAGELSKTRETKSLLEDALLAKQYGRDTCLIALGGGVVSDLVGFIAATYCRGISTIYIPTTLLAMVDASIGGKTGVNTPYGKNMIGCFHQPDAVFIDTKLLTTLPAAEWHNGMAEIIKHSLIANPTLCHDLKNFTKLIQDPTASDFLLELIYKSCLIKKNIVEQDEKDLGIRQLLNFGHTIGHAIEAMENYQISHGEAVAIGMLVEGYLSVQAGFLSTSVLDDIFLLLQQYHLPLKTSAFACPNKMKAWLCLDKKALAKVPQFVLLDDMGLPHVREKTYTTAVPDLHLNQALEWAKKIFLFPDQ